MDIPKQRNLFWFFSIYEYIHTWKQQQNKTKQTSSSNNLAFYAQSTGTYGQSTSISGQSQQQQQQQQIIIIQLVNMHSLKNAMSNLLSVSVDIPKETQHITSRCLYPHILRFIAWCVYIRTITHVPEEHKSLLVE